MTGQSSKKRKIFDGRYEVLAIVGRGSDSVVYHARHVASPNEVALKVLVASTRKNAPSPTDRLRKEALTLVTSRHKYVVRLDDFHAIKDICYLSMEYAPEGDLRKYTTKLGGKLPISSATIFLKQCLEALEHIHISGIIHRDIKPDNILVINEKEIRLADFGLALLPGDEASIEELQAGVGTMNYLPPETLEGVNYDQKSDLYSLGVCFYEVLTGSNPFENVPLVMQVEARKDDKLKNIAELVPGLPETTAKTIMKLLSADANNRFQSASEALKFISPTDSESPKESDPFDFDDDDDAELLLLSEDPLEKAPENQDLPEALEAVVDDLPMEAPEPSFAPVPVQKTTGYAERNPSPTTKIDQSRIQEIIAKEQKKNADTAARKAKIAKESAAVDRQASVERKYDPKNTAHTQFIPPAKVMGVRALSKASDIGSAVGGRILSFLSYFPRRLQPIVVAVGSAVLVILAATLLHLISGTSSKDQSKSQIVTKIPGDVEQSKPEQKQVEPVKENSTEGIFPALKAGMYTGTLTGLYPGDAIPLTMISFPSQKSITVILGIEGWTPTSSATTSSDGAILPKLNVSSNGLILNFVAEQSGDIIKGTFTNSLSGQVGSWSVKPFSKE